MRGRWRDVVAATSVLTLGTVGNAVLPMPSAFAMTGALAGTLLLLGVALANALTCKLLLRASVATGATSYAGLAEAVGGAKLRAWTELWTALLLFGTNVGGLVQLGQGASYAIRTQWPEAPGWTHEGGSTAVLMLTLGVVFPLTLLPNMRKLEAAGACGSVVIWLVTLAVMGRSLAAGMPALQSGDWPAVGFDSFGNTSSAISIFSFAFYMQILLMPMLSEMPNEAGCHVKHRQNAEVVGRAATLTILGTAGATYLLAGFFGAAMFGPAHTADNLTENEWLPGTGTFILNSAVTVYLALSIPPILFVNMHIVRHWLVWLSAGKFEHLTWWHQRLVSLALVGLPCLCVALALPGKSAAVLSITGATGVTMLSFVMPVVLHLMLYFGYAHALARESSSECSTPHADPEHGADFRGDFGGEIQGGALDEETFRLLLSPARQPPMRHRPAAAGGPGLPREESRERDGRDRGGGGGGGQEEEESHSGGGAGGAMRSASPSPVHKVPSLAKLGLLGALPPYRQHWSHPALEVLVEVHLPALILLLSIFFSLSTLANDSWLAGAASLQQATGGNRELATSSWQE